MQTMEFNSFTDVVVLRLANKEILTMCVHAFLSLKNGTYETKPIQGLPYSMLELGR